MAAARVATRWERREWAGGTAYNAFVDDLFIGSILQGRAGWLVQPCGGTPETMPSELGARAALLNADIGARGVR